MSFQNRPAEVSMLSQCANSQCGKPFLRLGEGKLFQVEVASQCRSRLPCRTEKAAAPVDRYWLCNPAPNLDAGAGREAGSVPAEPANPPGTCPACRKDAASRDGVTETFLRVISSSILSPAPVRSAVPHAHRNVPRRIFQRFNDSGHGLRADLLRGAA